MLTPCFVAVDGVLNIMLSITMLCINSSTIRAHRFQAMFTSWESVIDADDAHVVLDCCNWCFAVMQCIHSSTARTVNVCKGGQYYQVPCLKATVIEADWGLHSALLL